MVAESWRQDPEREPRLAVPDPARAHASSRASLRRGRGRRCAAPARRSGRGADQRVLLAQRRRRQLRGRRGAGRAARAERGHAAAAALVALGDPQPGRAPARPATTSAARPPTARGRSSFVESVSGSHLDVAPLGRLAGRAHGLGVEPRRPGVPRRRALDPDPRRPRARRGARARRDRLPPERLAARRRPAARRTRTSR